MDWCRWGCSAACFALLACGPVVNENPGASGDESGTASSAGSTPSTSSSTTSSDPGGGASVGVTTTPDPSTTSPMPVTTSGLDTSSGPGDSSGTPFITDPDGGGFSDPCSIWDQDCPREDACRPWADDGGPVWNSARCSPLDPTPDDVGGDCVAENSAVSGVDSCGIGAMCFGVDEFTLAGTCVAFCGGTPQAPICTDPQDQCMQGNNDFIALCLPACDPLLQDCESPSACVGNWGSPNFVCMPPGAPYVNEDDVMPAACGVGRVAVPADLIDACDGSDHCCTDFCDLSQPNTCPGGLTCEMFVPEGEVIGVFDVGACVSPS